MAQPVSRIYGTQTMLQAVEAAVEDMPWLKPSDGALVALAKKYATQIDSGEDDGRAIGYLGQQLTHTLKALGGTPIDRKALVVEEPSGGAVGELRKARAARARGASDLDASTS